MRSILPLFVTALVASAPLLAVETIPVPEFRSVQLRGGGEVVVRPGPVQQVTILEGSSQFTQVYMERSGKLRIDACNRQCPQRYRLKIEIRSPSLPDVAISGGGSIYAGTGFATQRHLAAAVNGGGTVDVRAVDAFDISAAVNGGGQIFVRARNSLSAAVSGGGQIRYSGNPQVSMAVQGGGLVRRVD
jgi:hypothetical protein